MGPTSHGLFIIDSEISIVLMAMKRGNLWNSNSHQDTNTENLMKELVVLKKSLSSVTDFDQLNTVEFLMPFLDVIRSEDVTGHVTALAINSINKFLSYDLIDVTKPGVKIAVENLADAVTHARFVGTDSGNDEVVLMKIIDVMRLLSLSSVGLFLTNESICEIMQSTLRICFEPRLSELLRKTAQHALDDMVQLLFTKLPTFSAEQKPLLKKLKVRSSMDKKNKRKPKPRARTPTSLNRSADQERSSSEKPPIEGGYMSDPGTSLSTATSPVTEKSFVGGDFLARSPTGSVTDLTEAMKNSEMVSHPNTPASPGGNGNDKGDIHDQGDSGLKETNIAIQVTSPGGTLSLDGQTKDFTNEAGVVFEETVDSLDSEGKLIPYGLPALYELLRFLISLINPHEAGNTEAQINIGLSLITTALEVGVTSIGRFPSLLAMVQDNLCRSLISLLATERIGTFAATIRCCYLVFSVLKCKLKLQLESFLTKISEIISNEGIRVSQEQKELSIEFLVQLYKLPGFVTELYLNYDCGLYTANLFEELTKVLSKNAFPQDRHISSTNKLALEGLMVVLNQIERHCQRRISDRVPQPPQYSPRKEKLCDKVTEEQKSDEMVKAVPSHESLMAIKHKKKLTQTGTDQFNVKPSKGISYLQEARLLSNPIDPYEVAHWLRENPHLDKNMIGEYISNKKNLDILKAFVKSFNFKDMRIDEALRMFLQTFRLPGEAPLISNIMEIFGEHWHTFAKAAGFGLADEDSPYTLAYAVIMLNTDQHNPNAGKNSVPMTQEQFIRNLRGTNGGGDHDPEVMGEVYQAIRNDEIVMPQEQSGLVRENYLWKLLLARSVDEEDFMVTDNGMFDHNLFGLSWGPALASLSYILDKSREPEAQRRALDGFSKCAMIAAHYAMSDVIDNLIISLSKFSTLMSVTDVEYFKVQFGANNKALLVTRALFSLSHKYGDIIREGWKHITECLLTLFKCQLLPQEMMEAEDYIEDSGKVSLVREDMSSEKEDNGLINSLVSFIVASSEIPKELSPEEITYVDNAKKTVEECHTDHILQESKFLLTESLQELVKYLIAESSLEMGEEGEGRGHDQSLIFKLELITRITIANRDRVPVIWRAVSDHLHRVISVSSRTLDTHFQLERSVTCLLRLGVRLARKEDLASMVVQSLRILLAIKPGAILHVSKQVSYGLHELLKNNAANIHSCEDWSVIFTLLEVVGAGASPDVEVGAGAQDTGDSGQGGTDDEKTWVDLGVDRGGTAALDGYSIVHTRLIIMHCSVSFLKCCEIISFIVRDVVHITPENFSSCVAAIRTFVEASYRGENQQQRTSSLRLQKKAATPRSSAKKPKSLSGSSRKVRSEHKSGGYDADESSDEELVQEYGHVTMQLLELMHLLFSRAMGIQTAWERDTEDLWDMAWCPVLQGMARLCCDSRQQIRTQSMTLLQRSLLVPDLQVLSPSQWEFAFLRVLFPMLRKLLQMGQSGEDQLASAVNTGIDETKLRAAMMLSKVFLQHLTSLSGLPTFSALWLSILDLIGQFSVTASTDILADALPESLKNMLLVMDTNGGGLFFTEAGIATPLWGVTWGKIDTFMPGLREELFPGWEKRVEQAAIKQNQLPAPSQSVVDMDPPPPASGVTKAIPAAPVTVPPTDPISDPVPKTAEAVPELNPALAETPSQVSSYFQPPAQVIPSVPVSLPCSPSHGSGFAPIAPAPLQSETGMSAAPLAAPRPIIMTPASSPAMTVMSPANPLLSSDPSTVMTNIPQFVPDTQTSFQRP